MIPVQRPYLGPEELAAVGKVMDSRWLGFGATVKEFETRLREFLGARHVIAVNTGTSALHLAVEALGIEPGDEVIVPSLTYAASVQAILAAGATPVFCEAHPSTLNLDVADAATRITSRTRAIMPVHYGGLPCAMDEIMALAAQHGLKVVEDAAHAYGSFYKGRAIGTIGDITCFSFDPVKNITCGEGGAVVTDSDEVAEIVTHKRILGIDNDTWSRYREERNWFYEVVTPGYRYHLSNLNAAIGLVQMTRHNDFQSRKRQIVERYDRAFSGLAGLTLIQHDLPTTFPFCYILRVTGGRRDAFMQSLKQAGVATGVHYIPNHIQPLFAASRVPLPVTEQLFDEIVSLPLFFEMTEAEVDQVIAAVQSFSAG